MSTHVPTEGALDDQLDHCDCGVCKGYWESGHWQPGEQPGPNEIPLPWLEGAR
jgi:hypothetical protein